MSQIAPGTLQHLTIEPHTTLYCKVCNTFLTLACQGSRNCTLFSFHMNLVMSDSRPGFAGASRPCEGDFATWRALNESYIPVRAQRFRIHLDVSSTLTLGSKRPSRQFRSDRDRQVGIAAGTRPAMAGTSAACAFLGKWCPRCSRKCWFDNQQHAAFETIIGLCADS
jgi:hypothetical protein